MSDQFGKLTLESMNQAEWYNQWTLNKFKEYLNGKILEIGCGIGNFTQILTNYGQVWGIDISKDYVEQTKNLVGNKASVGIGDIEMGEYFFKGEKFNSIVCLNVLEHIENDVEAVKNMYKLLDDKGNLILLIPANPFLYGEIDRAIHHYRRYTKKEIMSKLKKEGFSTVNFRSLNIIGAIGWFISGRIFKNKIVAQSKIKLFNLLAPIFLKIEDVINPPFGTSFLIIVRKE